MRQNLYTEISVTLFPVQAGFTVRDEASSQRLFAQIKDHLEACRLAALFRTPTPAIPVASLELQCFPLDSKTMPHTHARAVRSAFMAMPWVGEVEVLGICRL